MHAKGLSVTLPVQATGTYTAADDTAAEETLTPAGCLHWQGTGNCFQVHACGLT